MAHLISPSRHRVAIVEVLLIIAVTIFHVVRSYSLISVDPSLYTFKFTQSTANLVLWTAPSTRRIRSDDTSPPSSATGSTLHLSCAREELESFQVVLAPTSAISSATVTLPMFSGLGPRVEDFPASWVLLIRLTRREPVGL